MKLIFATNFRNYSKLHEDPSSESRVVSCGRTDGPTDRTELVVAFRNFSNVPKNTCFFYDWKNKCVDENYTVVCARYERRGIIRLKEFGR